MQFLVLLIPKKWNNLERKFLNNVSPLKLSLGKLRLLSGLTEMAEEQSVSQQMWPETIASEHLVLLVAVIKNHCHRGGHSSWYVVWDAVQWCCCQRRVTQYCLKTSVYCNLTTPNIFKIIVNFWKSWASWSFISHLQLSSCVCDLNTPVCSVPLRDIVSCYLFHTIKSAQTSYYKCFQKLRQCCFYG